MAPFYGWGWTTPRLGPVWGGNLIFTTKFPEIPGTHFIELRRMKGWVDLTATQSFWTWDPWTGNPGLVFDIKKTKGNFLLTECFIQNTLSSSLETLR